MASTSPFGGYKRIQFSGDTAAEFEKYNPSCRPFEPIAVRKANGHVCVKMNCTESDKLYSEIPIIWDQDVAGRLESDLAESQKAAENAKQSETTAKEYARTAADTLTKVDEHAAAIMTCEGFKYVISAEDGGIDIVPTDPEETTEEK